MSTLYAGLTAPEVVRHLVTIFPRIVSISLATYLHLPVVQDRFDLTTAEQSAVDFALRLRAELNLPFWDGVMLATQRSSESLHQLLDSACMHMSLRGRETVLNRNDVLDGQLGSFCEQNDTSGSEVSILSEVTWEDGTVRHLALMDFHARPHSRGFGAVLEVSRRIFDSGAVILESGESYHAYGLMPLDSSEFMAFLGRALLYAPIVDRAYIAHQLIEGRCALRISGGTTRGRKRTPRVVRVI